MRLTATTIRQNLLPASLTALALMAGAALIIFAMRVGVGADHKYGDRVPRTTQEICALLGAIIGDSDSPQGLSAEANQLYADDGCATVSPPSARSTP